jgi:hypothetical protein
VVRDEVGDPVAGAPDLLGRPLPVWGAHRWERTAAVGPTSIAR